MIGSKSSTVRFRNGHGRLFGILFESISVTLDPGAILQLSLFNLDSMRRTKISSQSPQSLTN